MNTDISGLYSLPPLEHARGFFDPEKTNKWIKEYAVSAFEHKLNKLESNDFQMKVTDVHVHEPEKKPSWAEQKKASLNRNDLSYKVKGTVELIDKKTGKPVDKKTVTLANIPFVTERNSSMYNGSEYVTTCQQRLKPGVYARVKENGELDAHVNVKSGTGMTGHVSLQPSTGLFNYKLGTTQIKLYGLLRGLGMPDAQIEEAWGTEIYLKNKNGYDGNEISKAHDKIFSKTFV